MRHAACGLLDNLGAGGFKVRHPVRRVVVLVRIKIAGGVGLIDFAAFADGSVRPLGRVGEHHFRSIGLQDPLTLERGIGRQAQFHVVMLRRGDHGVCDAGVAAGGIENDKVVLQHSRALAF